MSNKLQPKDFNSGIVRGVYSGRHRLDTRTETTPKAPKNISIIKRKDKIEMEALEDGIFDQNNSDRRGNKSKLEFRGHAPVRWNPSQDFIKEGYLEDGGAFKGGRGKGKAGKSKDYSAPFGNASSKNIDPHPIRTTSNIKLKTKS